MNNVVFVVAHPDDESLWVGGLLNFLNETKSAEPHVICMTGKQHEFRYSEFKRAIDKIGVEKWSVGNIPIPTNGEQPLTDIDSTYLTCLNEIGLKEDDIKLVITHSPFGDEHNHLQHRQLFDYLNSKENKFAFFSTITLPLNMTSVLRYMKRLNNTHLINLCTVNNYPSFELYAGFKIDCSAKESMLDCYDSINKDQHRDGYASWDSCFEGVYFRDENSFSSFQDAIDEMEIPSGTNFTF